MRRATRRTLKNSLQTSWRWQTVVWNTARGHTPLITHHTPSTLKEDPLSVTLNETPPHRRPLKDNTDNSYAKMASTSFQSTPPTQCHYQRQQVLHRAPTGAYMTVTGSNGTRVYLRMDQGQRSISQRSFGASSQLLTTPIAELRDRVEEEVGGHLELSSQLCSLVHNMTLLELT